MHRAVKRRGRDHANGGEQEDVVDGQADISGVVQHGDGDVPCGPGKKQAEHQQSALVDVQGPEEVRVVGTCTPVQHWHDVVFVSFLLVGGGQSKV